MGARQFFGNRLQKSPNCGQIPPHSGELRHILDSNSSARSSNVQSFISSTKQVRHWSRQLPIAALHVKEQTHALDEHATHTMAVSIGPTSRLGLEAHRPVPAVAPPLQRKMQFAL